MNRVYPHRCGYHECDASPGESNAAARPPALRFGRPDPASGRATWPADELEAGIPGAALDEARRLAAAEAQTVHERVVAAGWRWVVPSDEEYPSGLATISDPPLGLFVRGNLLQTTTVAVVGSRKATPYGLQVARLLGEELGREGLVMVSGMARGVDAAAHRGALDAGGPTWAVWGTGPDRVYPPEHGELAGIAAAVVVVEAAGRSGALVTARLAVEEGREVLAVPGNIFSTASVGPNTLLRVGARPLLTPRDLFDAIGHVPATETGAVDDSGLLRFMGGGEALTVDELAARAKIDAAAAATELLSLELAGAIERMSDGRFARTRGTMPAGADLPKP